jgi:hypothetical protein
MERQREEKSQVDSGRGGPLKKTYVSPELQDWGSIQDLTQGLGLGGQDIHKNKGGSRPT